MAGPKKLIHIRSFGTWRNNVVDEKLSPGEAASGYNYDLSRIGLLRSRSGLTKNGAISATHGVGDRTMFLAKVGTTIQSLYGPFHFDTSTGVPRALYFVAAGLLFVWPNTRPNTGAITDPENGETGVSLNPTIVFVFDDPDGGYYGTGEWYRRIWCWIYSDPDHTDLVWEGSASGSSITVDTENGTFQGSLAGQTHLAADTDYWLTGNGEDVGGSWSDDNAPDIRIHTRPPNCPGCVNPPTAVTVIIENTTGQECAGTWVVPWKGSAYSCQWEGQGTPIVSWWPGMWAVNFYLITPGCVCRDPAYISSPDCHTGGSTNVCGVTVTIVPSS